MTSNLTKANIAICISGGGSTMQAVLAAHQDLRLTRSRVALVISNNSEAGGIAKARHYLSEDQVVTIPNKGRSEDSFGDEIRSYLAASYIDYVFLCGFIPRLPMVVVSDYRHRCFNQHNAPLDNPKRLGFGGKGMHGRASHAAVLYFAERVSRPFHSCATVHEANERLDEGDIVGVMPVELQTGDTPQSLADRMLPREHQLVVQTIYALTEFGRLSAIVRREPLIQSGEEQLLAEAIAFGRAAFPKG